MKHGNGQKTVPVTDIDAVLQNFLPRLLDLAKCLSFQGPSESPCGHEHELYVDSKELRREELERQKNPNKQAKNREAGLERFNIRRKQLQRKIETFRCPEKVSKKERANMVLQTVANSVFNLGSQPAKISQFEQKCFQTLVKKPAKTNYKDIKR